MSARSNFIKTIRASAEARGNKRYFVKRGVINWATFNFASHQFAMSMLIEDTTFMRVNGMQEMTFSLEAATVIPDSTEQPEIDDGIIDILIEDMEAIFAEARVKVDAHGDSVALGVDTESARIVEFHDSALRVQGIIATVIVKY